MRDLFLDWVDELLAHPQLKDLGEAIATSLGLVAQTRLEQVHFLKLGAWMSSIDANNFASRVRLVGQLLASAAEDHRNKTEVIAMVETLLSSGRAPIWKQFALALALGRLGLVLPEVAIHIMKKLGRDMFFDPRHRALTFIAFYSPLFFGTKTDADTSSAYATRDNAADESLADKDAPDAIEQEVIDDAREGTEAQDADGPSGDHDADGAVSIDHTADAADTPNMVGAGEVPSARYLAMLGDWADEAVKDQAGKGLRQVPIYALLEAVARMPIYTTPTSTRLTVQDLVERINRINPDILVSICAGFSRAGLATRYGTTPYLPRLHLKNVFQRLWDKQAREAKQYDTQILPARDNTDPLLVFTASVYACLIGKEEDAADFVLRGCGSRISAQQEAFIKTFDPAEGGVSPLHTVVLSLYK